MITLTTETLPKYFTIADLNSSWYTEPTNTFDFINRQSRTLLVTVGDSWTYGADLKPASRLDNVYGGVLSNMLDADWLNLGLSATGNFWLASRVEEFAKIYSELDYDRVILVCVFTGIGRWFNTVHDVYVPYTEWFKEIDGQFDKLLEMLNRECVNRIINAVADTNIELKVGTNFVEPLGFEQLTNKQVLPTPWYKLLYKHETQPVYNCSYFDRMDTALEFVDSKHRDEFKRWAIKIVDGFNTRLDVLSTEYFSNYHPIAAGHRIWAKYVYENLEC